jgi:carbon-monoxide dehydrogenase large subunit
LNNPLGAKGVGESGTLGAPPALINAVLDALRPLGVDQIDMPATPSRVWAAIKKAQEKPTDQKGAIGPLSLSEM